MEPAQEKFASRATPSMGSLSAEEAFIFNEGMTAASLETAAAVASWCGIPLPVREL
jgi:hypothetical protein